MSTTFMEKELVLAPQPLEISRANSLVLSDEFQQVSIGITCHLPCYYPIISLILSSYFPTNMANKKEKKLARNFIEVVPFL